MKLLIKVALGVCLLASLTTNAQTKKVTPASPAQPVVTTPTQAQLDAALDKQVAEFKSRNTDIKSFSWDRGMNLTIEKTDGTIEKYMMDRFNDEQKAWKKYGRVPVVLPPAPPATTPGKA